VVQTPPHWRIWEQQQGQTPSENPSESVAPGIPRERRVCDVMRFLNIQAHMMHAPPNHPGDPMIPMITFMDFLSV
jgi:hypothetical protein